MRAIRRPRPTQALCQTDAMITRTPRILLASALAAALFFTGCSDDGGDDAADTGNGGTVSAEYAELCDAARSGQNASGSEQLAAAEAQLAAAPDDVKEDFEKVVEFVRYRTENAADAAGIEERLAAVMEPLGRAVAIIQRECGFNPLQF